MSMFLRVLHVVLLCAVSCTLCGEEILIESRSGGKNFEKYRETAGAWENSNTPATHAKSTADGTTPNIGSRKFMYIRHQTIATAQFTPDFPADGHYYVYTTWPKAANAVPVEYIIHHADGVTSIPISQNGGFTVATDPNPDIWINLGDYSFKKGTDSYVELFIPLDIKPAVNHQTGQAYSDSVLFSDKPIAGAKDAKPVIRLPESVIIETREGGLNFDKYSEMSGKWINSGDGKGGGKSRASGLSDPALIGSRKLVFTNDKGVDLKSEGAARFYPELPSNGKYYVYATWPREANAEPVDYGIRHMEELSTKTIIQDGWDVQGQHTANEWQLLGHYEFSAGHDQYVEVYGHEMKRPDSRNLGQLYADAIMFSQKSVSGQKINQSAGNGKQESQIPVTQAPIQWLDNIDSALAAASRSDKKILLFFHAPESIGSRYFDETIFSNAAVRRYVQNNYVAAKINFPNNAARASQLGVFKGGTIVIYSSKGQALLKIDGRKSPEEFLAQLRNF